MPHPQATLASLGVHSLTCPHCGNFIENPVAVVGNFCTRCGSALRVSGDSQAEEGGTPPADVSGLAPWRGGEVALGVFIILAAMIPVIILAGETIDRAGQYGTALAAWASSNLMGLVILAVVWQLGLQGTKANLFGAQRSDRSHDASASQRAGLRSLGLNLPKTGLAWTSMLTLAVLAASLAFTGAYAASMRWLGAGDLVPPEITPDVAFPGAASALTFQALAVWTPVTEEIFFRGFILAGLTARLGVRGAIIASAMIFSMFHIDPGVLAPIFVTGLLLAWLYHRTGSLWPSIAAHAGQNSLAVVAAIYLI